MRRTPFAAALTVVAALVVATTVVGHAAVLPLRAHTLLATTFTGRPTNIPAPLVRDTFTGTSSLAAHTADTGQSWQVLDGVWHVQGTNLRTTTTAPRASATVPTTVADAAVQATFAFGSTQGSAGLVLCRDPSNGKENELHVEYAGGRIVVTHVERNSSGYKKLTVLWSVDVPDVTAGTPVRLTAVRTEGRLVVAFAGTVVLDRTLPAALSAELTGTSHGVLTLSDSATTIDDFEVHR